MHKQIVVLIVLLTCAVTSAQADESDSGWRVDFGPYMGYYDFDSVTQFEDRAMFGLRMGVHRGQWFRFEGEFDEVYTRRTPLESAARQATLAIHGRVEPPTWRIAPSALAGVAFVMLDDSENPDAFSEAWDFGLGLAWRVSDSWRIRGEYMMRYQRFRVRDPQLPPDDPASQSDPMNLWGRSLRVGAFYDFPTERNGKPVSYPVELGVFAGFWNFNSVFSYDDDAVLGLRGGVGLAHWFRMEVELSQITTANSRTGEWTQAVSFAMHGLFEFMPESSWRPGILAGVAFTGLDNEETFDSISEGFDLGPSLRASAGDRIEFRGDLLLRYQSVRLNDTNPDGSFNPDDMVDYVWSYGIRLGVSVEI